MGTEYFFNIGVLPDGATNNEISFVLNIRYTRKPDGENTNKYIDKSYDDKMKLLHDSIQLFSYLCCGQNYESSFASSARIDNINNNLFSYSGEINSKNIPTDIKSFKLGIVCNGYYNNHVCATIINETVMTDPKPNIDRREESANEIGELLCSLGYNVECVAENFENPMIKTKENESSIPKLYFPLIGNESTYKSIAGATTHYYRVKDNGKILNIGTLSGLIFGDIKQQTQLTQLIGYLKQKETDLIKKFARLSKTMSSLNSEIEIPNDNYTSPLIKNQDDIYILSFPNFEKLEIFKNDGELKNNFITLKEYLKNNIDTYIEIVKSLPLMPMPIMGGSKKRIPKRKYKYTRKLYK